MPPTDPRRLLATETYMFAAGALWLFVLLLTVPLVDNYTVILLMLAAGIMAAMYERMGHFWRRSDTSHDTSEYAFLPIRIHFL